jgi:endopeptidase Clp ATP-binding regulatory subunit ClpX
MKENMRMPMNSADKFPSSEDIQKEFEAYMQSKFGKGIQVIAHMATGDEAQAEKSAAKAAPFAFDKKPREVKQYLDRFVIGQDEAKKALAIAVCDHYNQVKAHSNKPDQTYDYTKQNVLVSGPTGVGKTFLIKKIADLIDVPFVKADATRFTEAGYVGANVEELLADLVMQADGDIQKASSGIIYLDEADKLANSTSAGRDVSGRGVQIALLKLMEETEVDLRGGQDPSAQMQAFIEVQRKGKAPDRQVISTKHILFIVSGAFTGLEKIVNQRLRKTAIGFRPTDVGSGSAFHEATTEDFINFGFEPEFIGRLPVRVSCSHLDNESLYDILKHSESSILHQYIRDFSYYDIKLDFKDSALKKIAALASLEKTGARGLMTILERTFRHFKFELPSLPIPSLSVTPKLIDDPAKALTALQKQHTELPKFNFRMLEAFEQLYLNEFGIEIAFTDCAKDYLCKNRHLWYPTDKKSENIAFAHFCLDRLSGFKHGLKMIQLQRDFGTFPITRDCLEFPNETLETIIKAYYLTV